MKPFEKVFGGSVQTRVLEHLIKKYPEPDYASGIAQAIEVSHASIARVLNPLVEAGIVKKEKFGAMIHLYTIDKENPAAKAIVEFYEKLGEALN